MNQQKMKTPVGKERVITGRTPAGRSGKVAGRKIIVSTEIDRKVKCRVGLKGIYNSNLKQP